MTTAILIGPPGAGKSTVGPLLAGLLGVGFLDTDSVIEEAVGKPVGDIFIDDGEAAFRALEQPAVAGAIEGHHGILALGSGAILDAGARRLLAGHRVVYLETGFAAVARRSGLDGPRPPLPGNPRGRMRELLEQRRPVYEDLAWLTVATDDREPPEIAELIAEAVAGSIAADVGEGAGSGDGWAAATVTEAGGAGGAPGVAGGPPGGTSGAAGGTGESTGPEVSQ
ncbi:MAG: shikimate kinase [Streptosporangiaceae bacterium]|nr:shikimate kinase [Streptosporangiaceae bacterium]